MNAPVPPPAAASSPAASPQLLLPWPVSARLSRRPNGPSVDMDKVYSAAECAIENEFRSFTLQERWARAVARRLDSLPARVAKDMARLFARVDVDLVMTEAMDEIMPSTDDMAVAAVDAVLTGDLIQLIPPDEDVDLGLIESAVAELRGGRIANALTDLSRSCSGLQTLEDKVTPR